MLLRTDKYFLLVSETKEALVLIFLAGSSGAIPDKSGAMPPCEAEVAGTHAAWWSERLKSPIWFSKPGDVFLALSKIESRHENFKFVQVLHGEKTGWIRAEDWLDLKSVDQ